MGALKEMSRLSSFVMAGGLWTTICTAYLTYFVFACCQLSWASLVLAGCMALVSMMSLAVGLARFSPFRHIATTLHLSIPMVWAVWLESVNQCGLSTEQWVTFAGCAFFGAALADQGVSLELAAMPPVRKFTPADPPVFKLGGLTALDSGGFPVRQLSAAESGSFRMP